MKYLHTMVRVTDLDKALDFYCNKLGLSLLSRRDVPAGRYTLAFLAAPGDDQALLAMLPMRSKTFTRCAAICKTMAW
jgi:catechol 2,3-dioxygenase-like lactoylglutathione lyase family enzyme